MHGCALLALALLGVRRPFSTETPCLEGIPLVYHN